MLEEVFEVGDQALIFTQFTRMGRMLESHLEEVFGCEVLFLHGRVPKTQRDRMVARFQERAGGPPVFILSLKAGGTGLNLTAANHVFHFDRWWNPAVEDQATDRIDEMIERKRGVADRVVGSGEAWLTELSDREIKEIVALRAEAFGDD